VPRKRDESPLLDLLFMAPIWCGPVFAVVAFLALRFAIPAIFSPGSSDPMAKSMATAFGGLSYQLAPLVFGIIVLSWVGAEIYKLFNRRLLDKQAGLETIRSLTWKEFERLVGEAFKRKGYSVEETGRASGDGGVDLLLQKGDQIVLVQCKQWKAWKVGVKTVRELRGVVASQKAHSGIVVTCGHYTEEARAFAEMNPIQLIDGPALASLVASVQAPGSTLPSSRVEPLPPATKQAPAPQCPKCGAAMVLRTAGKGPNAGKRFWGCPSFPKCRGTKGIS